MSLEKLLYRFLLDSPGTLLNSGESIGIGVRGIGDEGGDVDIGDSDELHADDDEGKNDDEDLDRKSILVVDTQSSLKICELIGKLGHITYVESLINSYSAPLTYQKAKKRLFHLRYQ